MDVKFINPFLKATNETFKTMIGIEPTMEKPIVKSNAEHSHDVSGVIGLSGEAQGSIAISFSKITALRVVSKMLGSELTAVNSDLTDGIGEIANIIAGYSKQYLTDYKVSVSLPNVVVGSGHELVAPSGVSTIVVPYKCEFGEFAVEIALKTS
ncbi:MAG: chemotaxis protein CheX [Chitinispirillales bacterium]|jgi:chemotaxis protein CheX|nr:chemotaxis protein CheX [Chitinispirillales bacterium]